MIGRPVHRRATTSGGKPGTDFEMKVLSLQ